MILAIETATPLCSVALQNQNGDVTEKRISGRSVHSEYLFIFIDELFRENNIAASDLEAVLVSNGPGSYTGLRIAASAVKGLLFGTEVPVYAVETLAGFAASQISSEGKGKVHAVINARRTHLYYQQFELNPSFKAIGESDILEISEVESMISEGDVLIGTGLERLNSALLEKVTLAGEDDISASHLLKLWEHQSESTLIKQTSIEALDPNYISSSQVNNTNKIQN